MPSSNQEVFPLRHLVLFIFVTMPLTLAPTVIAAVVAKDAAVTLFVPSSSSSSSLSRTLHPRHQQGRIKRGRIQKDYHEYFGIPFSILLRAGASSFNQDPSSPRPSLDDRIRNAILRDIFSSSSPSPSTQSEGRRRQNGSPLLDLGLAGYGSVGDRSCLFLAKPSDCERIHQRHKASKNMKNDSPRTSSSPSFQAIALPLESSGRLSRILPLIESAFAPKPMSKTKCLSQNTALINRDGGLFDNIPWNEWSVRGNDESDGRDAAGNLVDVKFRFGKRDAYNRFIGKDWPGRSFSIGNLAMKTLYSLEKEENDDDDKEVASKDGFDGEAGKVLARRIIDLEYREAVSALAGAEQQVAINRASKDDGKDNDTNFGDDELLLSECRQRIEIAQDALTALEKSTKKSSSFLRTFLTSIAESTVMTDFGKKNNTAPYRGAYGYPPNIDSKSEMFDAIYPYTGPFDLMVDMITNQLRAEVVGAVIEDTWLLDEAVVLGGACVLRRNRPKRGSRGTMMINGEEVPIPWDEDDEEEEEVKSDDLFVVECDGEEAVGLALAASKSISVEYGIWEGARLSVSLSMDDDDDNDATILPTIIPVGDSTFIETANTNQDEEDANDISSPYATNESSNNGPKTTASLFSSSPSISVTIPSISVFDSLTIQDKAKILLSLDSFRGKKLPRPRIIRQSNPNSAPLDKLILPLMDESVRRQYQIRLAEQSGDFDTANELRNQRSERQIAKELSEAAQNDGNEMLAQMWQEEAEFRGDLRADVTQDEGSYSRFLDKDDWYERDRVSRAKKLKKTDFGNLLDGIE
eukprot:CAMPEP_0195511376 /NCGR_PEP_ID=MMETSP0794_2-20130614/3715_1 /TAXON_ID=515487 /ORGANISM="Stephanopyxis turris, Strain CCMP 815" /LENGTH=805 /DNA_ID=CAMNT_0040638957 /DNA_START=205 /DNA_END=2622 /DNA_ORIENTATION=-